MYHKKTKKTFKAICFTTMQLPCFNEFKELFYVLNEKIIPDNIYEILTPRSYNFSMMNNGRWK